MSYDRVKIYFMTGTGNSYRAANWMIEAAQQKGINSTLVPIEEGRPGEELGEPGHSLLGLAYPTHGFTAP